MDNIKYATEHRKGQHLLSKERHEIEVRLKDDWSIYQIARHLGRPYNTIKNEIRRGTVTLYHGKVERYKADSGKAVYCEHRSNSTRNYRCMETVAFLRYIVIMFRERGWSLDACVGNAMRENLFPRSAMVCTKTLYNYVDLGLLPIKNIDLPEKLKRNTKVKRVRKNKRRLGQSIEERPEIVNFRREFGHWEIDTVIGRKSVEGSVVMTLVERMTRMCIWVKASAHTAEAINETLEKVLVHFGEQASAVFKSITGDNGSEFAELTAFESRGIAVYFTHPYASCEKGTNKCHNRMLRRFIPKGKSIESYSAEDICFFADRINGLPRKLLGYHTPEELFDAALDRIYFCFFFVNYCNLLLQFAKKSLFALDNHTNWC